MVENGNSSNNGHSPFRRYVPPTPSGNGKGQIMPFPHSTPAPQRPTPSAPSSARRSRSGRRRWRQWVNTASMAAPRSDLERMSPASAPSPPSTPLNPNRNPSSPAENRQSSQLDDPPMPEPSRFVKHPQGQSFHPDYPPRPKPPSAAAQSVPAASRFETVRPPTSKVTPLRRKPVWSSPDERTGAGNGPPLRDRKPGRRRTRKAPRPVLYGIRLLILGTGIAAIAGTLLSTLNPEKNATGSAPNRQHQETPVAALGRNRGAALSVPLPLTEELAYLETDLIALEGMTPGLTQAVFFYDLDTGNYVDVNGTSAIAAASTIKVPILAAFLAAVDAGTLRLDQAVTLREDLIAGGSGEMQTHAIGSQYTALEVATEMIVNSDNTATNMVIDLLGGKEALNQTFQQWGLNTTVLRNPLPDLEGTNTSSPADLVRLMALVDQGSLLTVRSRDRLLGIMQRTYNRTLIPDGLEDDSALVFNKTGDIGTALGDVALVDLANGRRYAIGILVTRSHNDGRANELIRRIAGRIHQEMSQPISPVGGSANPSLTESAPTGNPMSEDGLVAPALSTPESAPDSAPETDSFSNPQVPQG